MLQGTYYKEWSAVLGRAMEFKVYGTGGAPVLAFPARGGRFYDWENNGMPDAVAALLQSGRLQLFCADSIDAESLLADGAPLRRRAEMQEKYFNYITRELAARVLELNAAANAAAAPAKPAAPAEETPEAAQPARIWCVGADLGAYHAVNCRLRRPELFCGAVGLSGLYDLSRLWGSAAGDDLALRNSPLDALREPGVLDAAALAAEGGDTLVLCAGQSASEDEARADARALCAALEAAGLAVQPELWGADVTHDWYWWGKEWNLFAGRLFG